MWSSLQHLLETAIPHVLIILDCCFAANVARDTTQGTTKELLAACGRENLTLGVGLRSFTSALIDELRAFGPNPFTVAMLHSRLIKMRWRLTYTPIYALLSEHGGNSIHLEPIPRSAQSRHVQLSHLMNPPASSTKVLLTVSVAQNAELNIDQWTTWLQTLAPVEVQKLDMRIEAIYRSHSTLVLFSLSTCIWDRLRECSAYQFIAFITSSNILPPSVQSVDTGNMDPAISPDVPASTTGSFDTLVSSTQRLDTTDAVPTKPSDVPKSTAGRKSPAPWIGKDTGERTGRLLVGIASLKNAIYFAKIPEGYDQASSVIADDRTRASNVETVKGIPNGAKYFKCMNCASQPRMDLVVHVKCVICGRRYDYSSIFYD